MSKRSDRLQNGRAPVHGVEVDVLREDVDAVDEDGQLRLDDRRERMPRVIQGRKGHDLADEVFKAFSQFFVKNHFRAQRRTQLKTVVQ